MEAVLIPAGSALRENLVAAVDVMMARCRGTISWGKTDCVFLVADAIGMCTGRDLVPHLRGRWSTKLGADRVLKRLGHESLRDAVFQIALRADFESIDASESAPGDLGVVQIQGQQACAMKHRSNFWIARTNGGFAAVADDYVLSCWRVA